MKIGDRVKVKRWGEWQTGTIVKIVTNPSAYPGYRPIKIKSDNPSDNLLSMKEKNVFPV